GARLGSMVRADDEVRTMSARGARCVSVGVDHVAPDDQLAINHEAGDGARTATDLEDTLAQAITDSIVDPAVVSVGALHDFECRCPGWQVHVASHVKNAIIRSR